MDQSPVVTFLIIAVLCALFAFYFLPTFIARDRNFSHKAWLFWANLFLGWTFVGWGLCLIWAACAASSEADAYYRAALQTSGGERDRWDRSLAASAGEPGIEVRGNMSEEERLNKWAAENRAKNLGASEG